MGQTFVFYSEVVATTFTDWLKNRTKSGDLTPSGEAYVRWAENTKGIGIATKHGFKQELDKLKTECAKIDKLIIVTHGDTGWFWFGDGQLIGEMAINSVANMGYSDLFTPGAHIFFQGCHIAGKSDRGDGEKLLKAMARTFLSRNGGRVGGCTAEGKQLSFLGLERRA